MRISKVFNNESYMPLVIKALANDTASADALGADVAHHLEDAKTFFDNQTEAELPNRQNKEYQGFAFPILNAFAQITDPTFKHEQGRSPTANNLSWITKVYAERAMRTPPAPIPSDDLHKIHDELAYFAKAKKDISKNHSSDLNDYKTYDDFAAVVGTKLEHSNTKRPKTLSPEIEAETTFLYDGPEGKVVLPHSVKSSQFWGRGTKWCLSGTKDANEFFPNFSRNNPTLMYIPSSMTGADNAMTGKTLIAHQLTYDEFDKNLPALPPYVTDLHQAALDNAPEGQRQYIEMFGPPNPDNAIDTNQPLKMPQEPSDEYRDAMKKLTSAGMHDSEIFQDPDFIETLIDMAENTEDAWQQKKVLKYLHRAPCLFGKMTADFQELKIHAQAASDDNTLTDVEQTRQPEIT